VLKKLNLLPSTQNGLKSGNNIELLMLIWLDLNEKRWSSSTKSIYINFLKTNTMTEKITFNELRKIKDTLPDGSMHRIADELGLDVETVRNYFGGANYAHGKSVGLHIEQGPNGGIVLLDDTTILEKAQEILQGH
jgi:hypothetical protein